MLLLHVHAETEAFARSFRELIHQTPIFYILLPLRRWQNKSAEIIDVAKEDFIIYRCWFFSNHLRSLILYPASSILYSNYASWLLNLTKLRIEPSLTSASDASSPPD